MISHVKYPKPRGRVRKWVDFLMKDRTTLTNEKGRKVYKKEHVRQEFWPLARVEVKTNRPQPRYDRHGRFVGDPAIPFDAESYGGMRNMRDVQNYLQKKYDMSIVHGKITNRGNLLPNEAIVIRREKGGGAFNVFLRKEKVVPGIKRKVLNVARETIAAASSSTEKATEERMQALSVTRKYLENVKRFIQQLNFGVMGYDEAARLHKQSITALSLLQTKQETAENEAMMKVKEFMNFFLQKASPEVKNEWKKYLQYHPTAR